MVFNFLFTYKLKNFFFFLMVATGSLEVLLTAQSSWTFSYGH